MGIVRENCTSRTQVVNPMPPIMEPGEFFMPYPLEVEVGGATVFVVPVGPNSGADLTGFTAPTGCTP